MECLDVLRAMRGANPEWTRSAADLLVQLHERAGAPEKAAQYREIAKSGVQQ